MKNILMISYVFPPANSSGTARPYFFARYLPHHGYHPRVLTIHPENTLYFQDDSVLPELEDKCETIRINPWLQKNNILKNPFTKPVYHRLEYRAKWLWPAIVMGWKMFRKNQYELIWATGDPWTSLIAGAWLSKFTRKPFIADFRDPWTYGFGWKPTNPWNARRQQAQERFVIRNSTRTVFTSPLTTEIMQHRFPAYKDRLTTITNGFFEEDVDPARKYPESFCLFRFVGILPQRDKGATILFEAIRNACQDRQIAELARFEFVGVSAGYEKLVKSFSLQKQVVFSPPVSFEQSRALMRGADVLITFKMLTGPGKDIVSGKSYEYLASGRPILTVADEGSGDAWLMHKTGAGVVTGVQDPEKIAEGIRHYFYLWKENLLESPKYKIPIERFSREHITGELAYLFNEVLQTKNR